MTLMLIHCEHLRKRFRNSPAALVLSVTIGGSLTGLQPISWPLRAIAMLSGLRAIMKLMRPIKSVGLGLMLIDQHALNISQFRANP